MLTSQFFHFILIQLSWCCIFFWLFPKRRGCRITSFHRKSVWLYIQPIIPLIYSMIIISLNQPASWHSMHLSETSENNQRKSMIGRQTCPASRIWSSHRMCRFHWPRASLLFYWPFFQSVFCLNRSDILPTQRHPF